MVSVGPTIEGENGSKEFFYDFVMAFYKSEGYWCSLTVLSFQNCIRWRAMF